MDANKMLEPQFSDEDSPFLRAQNHQPCLVTVSGISEDELERTSKKGTKYMAKCYIMHFHEFNKGLVLNKVNTEMAMSIYGAETNGWMGKQFALVAEETYFNNAPKMGLRLKAPAFLPQQVQQQQQQYQQPQQQQPQQQQPPQQPQYSQNMPAQQPQYSQNMPAQQHRGTQMQQPLPNQQQQPQQQQSPPGQQSFDDEVPF